MNRNDLMLLLAREINNCNSKTNLEDFNEKEIQQVEKVLHYVELFNLTKRNRHDIKPIPHVTKSYSREF